MVSKNETRHNDSKTLSYIARTLHLPHRRQRWPRVIWLYFHSSALYIRTGTFRLQKLSEWSWTNTKLSFRYRVTVQASISSGMYFWNGRHLLEYVLEVSRHAEIYSNEIWDRWRALYWPQGTNTLSINSFGLGENLELLAYYPSCLSFSIKLVSISS